MKKGLLLLLVMSLSSPLFATDELYVRQSADDDALFRISDIKEITFPSGQVVITMVDGSSKSYPSSTFVSLRFNGNIGSGVENAMVEDAISFDGVVVKSSQDGIAVYSTDGRLVAASQGAEVNVSSLASGIYIVKSGSLTSKIVK